MALEATHIKFALDLKDIYKVKNLDHYISGSIYPDSRYVTGVNRAKTHPQNLMGLNPTWTDFEKGWAAHIVCDTLGNMVRLQTFPELFVSVSPETQWLRATAMKIIEDLEVEQTFDLKKYLACLNYAANPCKENLDEIKKFNKLVQDTYKPDIHSLKQVEFFWSGMGLQKDKLDQLNEQANAYLNNKDIFSGIKSLYSKMVMAAISTLQS